MFRAIRKLFLALACILMLLTGCGTPRMELEDAQDALETFASTADISYGELTAQVSFAREDGCCKVVLIQPEAVEGMSFEFGENSVTVGYMGLLFDFDPDDLPAQAAAGMLVEVLDAALDPYGVHFALEDDTALLTGDSRNGEFALRLDMTTGALLSMELPGSGFSAAFH